MQALSHYALHDSSIQSADFQVRSHQPTACPCNLSKCVATRKDTDTLTQTDRQLCKHTVKPSGDISIWEPFTKVGSWALCARWTNR